MCLYIKFINENYMLYKNYTDIVFTESNIANSAIARPYSRKKQSDLNDTNET